MCFPIVFFAHADGMFALIPLTCVIESRPGKPCICSPFIFYSSSVHALAALYDSLIPFDTTRYMRKDKDESRRYQYEKKRRIIMALTCVCP